MSRSLLLLLLSLTVALPACSTFRLPRNVKTVVHQQERAMAAHFAAGEPVAGLRLARGLAAFDPQLADFEKRLAEASPEIRGLFEHSSLGINVSPRRDDAANVWTAIAWWLPDRLLDLLDVVSFDVRLGYGLAAELHLTRGLALGGGGSAGLGVGWHEQRSLGVRVAQSSGWNLGSLGGGFDWAFDVGTGERNVGAARREEGAAPADLIYQEWRDYWSLGASAHALLLGIEVDLHPLELADFLGGLVGFDLGHDDLATTRAEPLAGSSPLDLQTLRECLIDVPTMRFYREARDQEQALKLGEVSPPAAGP